MAVLIKNGSLKMADGEYRCCAEHGLSLVITARVRRDRQTLIFTFQSARIAGVRFFRHPIPGRLHSEEFTW